MSRFAIRWCVVALAVLGGAGAWQSAGQSIERDSWFEVWIGAARCGWLHERIEIVDQRILTTNEMELRMGRSGEQATIRLGWRFLETPSGDPIECESIQQSGSEHSRARYSFSPASIKVQESAGGRTIDREISVDNSAWMTPGEVERFVKQERQSGAQQIEYSTVDPASGMKVVKVVSKRTPVAGATTTRWTTTNSEVPMPSIEDVDDLGRVIESRTPMPIGDMVAKRCDEASARRALTGAAIDVIGVSVVQLATPCDRIARLKHARMQVKSKDGSVVALPSDGAQRMEVGEGAGVTVDVEVGRTSKATTEQLADSRYSQPSILVDSGDPSVVELGSKAISAAGLNGASSPAARAEAMRVFVNRYIVHKDMATAFAGASAVVKSRAGDCSEHAVLLAALLRAQGVPSRLCSGLVYAPEFGGKRGVFAWHMWTQALIDSAWVDLDATDASRPFHPGHILIATSAQDDAQVDGDFAGLLTTIGNITIEIIDVD